MKTIPEFYVPLTEVISEEGLPEEVRDIVAPLVDRLAYLEGYFLGDEEEGAIYSRIGVVDELTVNLPLAENLALIIGEGTIELQIVMTEGRYEAFIRLEQARFRIPREWLKPVFHDADDSYVVDENPNHFVEFDIPFGLRVTSDLDIEPIWPGGEAEPLEIPPVVVAGTEIIIDSATLELDLSGDDKCIRLEWDQHNLGDWLRHISPVLDYDDEAASAHIRLQMILGDAEHPIREVRLDWEFDGQNEEDEGGQNDRRSFSLPGFKLSLPSTPTYTLLLGGQQPDQNGEPSWRGMEEVAFILTFNKEDENSNDENQGNEICVQSTFAWGRDGDRELHNQAPNGQSDQTSPPEDGCRGALFNVAVKACEPVSLVLLEFDLNELALPKMFRQLKNPLEGLTSPNSDANGSESCKPTLLDTQSLSDDTWQGTLKLDLEGFQLPFLNRDGDDPNSNPLSQYIELDTTNLTKQAIPLFGDCNGSADEEPSGSVISLPLKAIIHIGPLDFQTEFSLDFNWETFALEVDHGRGINLVSTHPQLPSSSEQEHLGLEWHLTGRHGEERIKLDENGEPVIGADSTPEKERLYHYFTLVTDNHDYQIQQAKGATIEIHYTRVSQEPIIFAVTDFALKPNGIDLTAEVTDKPARLNGLDTRFRFHGSRLEIKENDIKDFTLAGSGPLPPDLVGDATADIWLQFAQRDGALTLVSGRAELKGNKLLHCQGTRFQFAVDALGLKFVYDGQFHLYFTVTGSAHFTLASTDDPDGPLALLPNIKIDLVECPLTGDMSVIAQHVNFLVEMPTPKSFNFLGCFEMELRGIGFLPQAKEFGNDGAMELTGQLKFAAGLGDTPDSRVDYHRLLIGLPKPGDIFPRLYFKNLPVNLNFGAAFRLSGAVEFVDEELKEGFFGEGMLQIQGLPTLVANFAFLRVRRDAQSPWMRAWFIYLEIRQASFLIPVVQIYLREVGLGFGYRFTLVSIKAADRANDMRQLLAELKKLSRTQGDLAKRDRWELDLEAPGEDVRWTIVLRALLAQTSAAASPGDWDRAKEEPLSCLFLFDAIVAFRSDLTFFMAVRGWINTNYCNYVDNDDGLREKPFVSGFVLLSPRQKRFLAHVSSNPEGHLGSNPELPELAQKALKSVQFSATLLIEPGLLHYELGWPNQLRWVIEFGPIKLENQGGFIFRISRSELVLGISYLARGKLEIDAGVSLGLVGASISARAEIAYGARLITLLQDSSFFVYGAIGLELQIAISIKFWIKIPLGFTSIKLKYRLSVAIGLTAGLELGLTKGEGLGLRGQGTIALSVMGHDLHFGASFAWNSKAVESALAQTQHVLDLGLEASDVEALPGLTPESALPGAQSASFLAARAAPLSVQAAAGFHLPGYSLFVIREPDPEGWSYFVLLPQGEDRANGHQAEPGFLPPPPLNLTVKLQFWRDFLDKSDLVPIRDLFKDLFGEDALSGKVNITAEELGQQWLVQDITEKSISRYHLEDTREKVVIKTLERQSKEFTYDTSQIGKLNDDGDELAGLFFMARLQALPGAPYARYLQLYPSLYRYYYQREDTPGYPLGQRTLDGFFVAALKKILAANKEPRPKKIDDIRFTRNGYIVKADNNRYRLVPSGSKLDVWKFGEVKAQTFVIEPDRLSYSLNNKKELWQKLVHMPGTVEIYPLDSPGEEEPWLIREWRITQRQEGADEKTYLATRHEKHLEVNLQIEEDFRLRIPATLVFSLDTSHAGDLDQGEISDSLRAEFADHGHPLADPSLSALEPGSLWLLIDTELTSYGEDRFEYVIRKADDAQRLDVLGGFTLQQYQPLVAKADPGWVDHTRTASTGGETGWKINWEATLFQGDQAEEYTGERSEEPTPESLAETQPQPTGISLAGYLKHAFVQAATTNDDGQLDSVKLLGDPTIGLVPAERVEDPRVYNPTEDAFEAAVRGAVEQFEASPFFKRDPSLTYDRLLEEAFRPDTTIYQADGVLDDTTSSKQAETRNIQTAVQLRGMVLHDLIADLKEYAQGQMAKEIGQSIPFQMGLVFRFKGRRPAWLDYVVAEEDGQTPKIRQRPDDTAVRPEGTEGKAVTTFNIVQADFSRNPPHFERVLQFSDATTVAITWDLTWSDTSWSGCTPRQAEPEHHLAHYEVRRRALDSSERDVVFTVKSAEVLHRDRDDMRGGAPVLKRLKPRFQVVDRFQNETLSDIADMPATGRSYLYTVTPVDFEGHRGRALTLVATRKPNLPPLVPADGELVVRYRLDRELLSPTSAGQPIVPQVVLPHRVSVEWREPTVARGAPRVPIAHYYLIFRKESTLPIGSYGLDSTTQRPRTGALPTTNARPLPTDIKIELDVQAEEPDTAERGAELSLDALRQAGVLPAEGGWRPESWRIFFQTVSVNGVPSALAPVELLLRAEMEAEDEQDRREERRPAELEWLAHPIHFPLLPPEDMAAEVGWAHIPMPNAGSAQEPATFRFSAELEKVVSYQEHPTGRRCLRLGWNQGPSHLLEYPLDLNAGYEILELDIDAHTSATFEDRIRLARALRRIQDVQMLPKDDLFLAPADTLSPNQWEAWYPSHACRRQAARQRPLPGSQQALSAWYSWRESVLEWPDPSGLLGGENEDKRLQALHPALQKILDALQSTHNIDLQTSPPTQPNTLADFMKSTAPESDPYGWGVLQRFGLSAVFTLHHQETGKLITGQELLQNVEEAIEQAEIEGVMDHLFVEILFQPGRSIQLEQAQAEPDALLGIVQVSLRPIPSQYLTYYRLEISGPPGQKVNIDIALKDKQSGKQSISLVNQADRNRGQIDLEVPSGKSVQRSIILPLNGQTTLLFRSLVELTVAAEIASAATGMGGGGTSLEVGDLEEFEPISEFSTYFRVPDKLADAFSDKHNQNGGEQWELFRRYAQALNRKKEAGDRIQVPQGKEDIETIMPDFVAWSDRFFAACGLPEAPSETPSRPWLATAYPRAGSPAYATPDKNGRLRYDHLYEDRWAHTYRYYIRPYGRYDLLWGSLRASLSLFRRGEVVPAPLPPATPDPAAGGLDVVLERTQPVDKPLILSTTRLDQRASPGQPVSPAPVWEVLIAQHAEQSLIERNQTLARQLAFRHIAFTLLRQVSHPEWVEQLQAMIPEPDGDSTKFEITVKPVEEEPPDIPSAYPLPLDHLPLGDGDSPLSPDEERSLALPERLGNFQQGAMALQWKALPFYYTHRLLVVAQTASTVSAINQVSQRNFEYRSPVADWRVEAVDYPSGNEDGPVRMRRVEIPLRRFWDSLPPAAQAAWPGEEPDPKESTEPGRKFSSLPDPEVVYQIVENFKGNVEVQVELYFDQRAEHECYEVRQLGQSFIAWPDSLRVIAPDSSDPQADFLLRAGLRQATKVAERFSYAAISETIDLPSEWPEGVQPATSFAEPSQTSLVWEGRLSTQEKAALSQLPGDGAFKEAITRLIEAAEKAEPDQFSFETAPLDPRPVPEELADQLELIVDEATQRFTALRWTGPLFDEKLAGLRAWAQVPEMRQGVECLVDELEERTIDQEVTPPRPRPDELPEEIREQLQIMENKLLWQSPPPTHAQREILDRIFEGESFGDQEFKTALAELLGPISVALPEDVEIPEIGDLPEAIRDRLEIDQEGNQLVWPGPELSKAEREALKNPFKSEKLKKKYELFIPALNGLLVAIEGPKSAEMAPLADRPRQAELSEELGDQLLIQPTQIAWRGRPRSQTQIDALNKLIEASYDQPFKDVIQAISSQLDEETVECSLDVPLRPRSAELPDELKEKLLIGNALLRYEGMMTRAEGRELRELFELQPDKKAIERLHADSLKLGLRDRELTLRTRRGSAATSKATGFELMAL
jgi:hypothetical protein